MDSSKHFHKNQSCGLESMGGGLLEGVPKVVPRCFRWNGAPKLNCSQARKRRPSVVFESGRCCTKVAGGFIGSTNRSVNSKIHIPALPGYNAGMCCFLSFNEFPMKPRRRSLCEWKMSAQWLENAVIPLLRRFSIPPKTAKNPESFRNTFTRLWLRQ